MLKLVRSIHKRLLLLSFVLTSLTGIGYTQSYKVGDLIINSDGSRGVVFFVHPDRSGGWMVALNDLNSVCEWGAYNDIPNLNNINLSVNPGSYIYTAALYDTAGYSNTQKIRTFQNNNIYYAAGQVDFANGWYLPAIGQLVVLWGAYPFIINRLTSEGGTLLTTPNNYWSSSEYDIIEAWNLNASQGYPRHDPKDIMVNKIRAVRSFSNTTMVYDTSLTYLWNTGSTQPQITSTPNATTSFTVTVTSGLGCTNSATQTVFVSSLFPQVIYDTVCLGSPYIGNGFDIGISDTQTVGTSLYTQTITQNGCQAIVQLHLFRKSNTSATLNVSLCDGEQYFLNGVGYYTAGTYHQNLTSQNGCDSLLTLYVSFYPNPNTLIHQTSCDFYSWNGVVYSQSGIYSQVFPTSNGCDSTVILHLTIQLSSSSTITQTVNENQLPITFNGQIFTNDVSNYLITIPNSNGCDSVITYNLVVNWNTYSQLQDTICQNSLPYIWNGITFYGSGNQIANFIASNGADSIIDMTLVVLSNTTSTFNQTVNENQLPIIFNGHVFTGDISNYLIIIPNANGCDSIISYNLNVNWNTSSFLMDTICESNLPYEWNGVIFIAPSVQTTILISYSGADSLVNMKLTVIPSTTSTIVQTVNEEQLPIIFNGESFSSEVSNYLIIVTNENGCDSLIYYTLNIIWANSIQVTDTICQNSLPYVWNGFTFNTAGTHNAYLTSSAGEDSIVMMTLIVNTQTYSTITQTVNENQLPYTFLGHIFTNEVDCYTIMINNTNGCDSIITFSLNVNWNVNHQVTQSICQNNLPYIWNGFIFNTAGNQYDTLTAFNGADSIVILTLFVHSNTSSSITQTVNENQLPITFNGHVFTGSVNNQGIIIPNYYGCDSVITYNLIINWNTSSQIQDTICQNQLPYLWNGVTFYTASTQSIILTSSTGADSLVSMTLYVKPISTLTVTQVVTENQLPITFNGLNFYSNIVNYPIRLMNVNGCDSIIYFSLHVHWNTIHLITDTICQDNLPYELNGIIFYSAGNHTDTLLSVFGSDSIVSTTLIVHSNTVSTIIQTVNENQLPITFNGETFMDEVVDQVFTIPNFFGCDSIITFTLQINWNVSTQIHDTICQNYLPYLWNGITFYNAGTQIATFSSASGSDSVVHMTLVVHQNSFSTFNQIANENDLPVIFNGHTFSDEVDHYTITIPNSTGCDSVIYYTLDVNRNTYQFIDTIVCSYNLPIIWKGFTFSQEGVVFDTTLNTNNTQHFITYSLNVDTLIHIQFSGFTNPVCPSIVSQQIIANITTGISPYIYYWSGDSIISSSQNQTLVKIAPSSCGNVRKIYLEVQDHIGCTIKDTVILEMNSSQTPVISSLIPIQNCLVNHCQFSVPNLDSLIRTFVFDHCYTIDSLLITQNPSSGTIITSPTNVSVSISNPCGMNTQTSVLVNIPSALDIDIQNINHVLCFGQNTGSATAILSGGTPNYSYEWSSQSAQSTIISITNSISNVTSGTYSVTVTDRSGCTCISSVTIQDQTESMNPGTISSNQSICFGENPETLFGNVASGGDNSYYQWQCSMDNMLFFHANGLNNQQNYSPINLIQNTYYRRAWISNACGTFYSDTLLISFFPVSRDTIDDVVCQGFEYINYGFHLPSDSTNYEGEHLFDQYQSNIYHCDSIITLRLKVNPSIMINMIDTICQGGIYLENGFHLSPPITDIVQVIEVEIIRNSVLGCDSIVSLALNVIDTSLIIEMITTDFCETDVAELVVQGFFDQYQWSTGERSQNIEIHQPGTYTVTASNEYCVNFGIYTIQPCDYYLYLPNSFTPNGDGLNDFFTLSTNNEKQLVEFNIVIYNRWGQRIFESSDPYFRWDGTYKNQKGQNNQIYTYVIEYQFIGKGATFLKGSVSVLN